MAEKLHSPSLVVTIRPWRKSDRSLALRASSHEKLQKWYLDAVNCRQEKDRAFAKACALALPEKYEKEISHE